MSVGFVDFKIRHSCVYLVGTNHLFLRRVLKPLFEKVIAVVMEENER